ncbi:MAG: hypothetical protein OEV44_12010, partial [Spirochaetota bacterium]|nr:hypothetical protein [Spirochaetota bacterium]
EVYSQFDENYEIVFNETLKDFETMTNYLRAYEWDKEANNKFHKLFESINVIPFKFIEECQKLIENQQHIEISDYMLPLTYGQFWKYKDKIEKHYDYWFIDINYNSDFGLYGETSSIL